ncbi:MAG: undecaprenyldiphospho-muramoylpentapeptide beta-N-acetylglucosaminyltransferase [Alphaproteobacteria bacterium]|nr:undecaprenyldiphospho-muramoylpentapeptide beta-N-acetylglucosaminyltransferase [Alphaproteobacteria bacterium]
MKQDKKQKKVQTMTKESPLIIVTTGGSGGHVFPAEAITGALLKKGYRVAFVTDKRGSAFRSLKNVQTYYLSAESVARRTFFQKITAGIKLVYGAIQAVWLLMRLKPALVIGVGGYASFPTVIAAQVCRIPTVLHEQNAVLGRANRTLAGGARLIATSFDPTYMVPHGIKQVRVGMPARPAVLALEKSPFPSDKKNFHLLIFGGSQGATFFSQCFPEVLAKLPTEYQRKLIITQQARPEDKEDLIRFYKQHGFENVTIQSFFDDMPTLIKESHLVIARSGASTITELEVIGRPAILVPLPTAADNHQMENARQFCDSGAGWLVNEKEFNAEQVAQRLLELMRTPDELKVAAERAYQRACPKAALEVVAHVTHILKGK